MKRIQIINHKNIFYIGDEQIEKYLTDGVLNLDSDTYTTENKKKAVKSFSLLVRVSKMLNKKQVYKKKVYTYTDKTIRQALTELKDAPEDLKALIVSDEEKKAVADAEAAELAKVEHENKKNLPLNLVWEEYLRHKVNGTDSTLGVWRESTARTYKSFYNKWIKDRDLGKTPIKEVTREQCDELISEIKKDKSLRTASTTIEVLRPIFEWYIEKHRLTLMVNPVPRKKKSTFNLQNERVVDVSLPQVRKLYEAIDNYDEELFRNAFKWISTGRRRGEVLSLKMDTVDLEDMTFMIEAKNNKAKVDMVYTLHPELAETLPEGNGYVFESPRKKGDPIHVDSITDHWKKIKEKVGGTFKLNGKRIDFTELHLHDLRHIVNGLMKSGEVPKEVRNKVMGHLDTDTNERYGPSYYGDAGRASHMVQDIIYGKVPADTKWAKYETA